MMGHAERILSLDWEELPGSVRKQARRCLKDILATAAGSLALPTAAPIEALVSSQFGEGPIPLLFQRTRTTLAGACFGNALRIDSLDCHDGFRPVKGHAGATVVPVALAACGTQETRGADLLAAIVAGYEIALRAGIAIHRIYAPAYHGSGSWAAVGAAAAGARILRLTAAEVDGVLGAAEYYGPMSPILRCTANPCIVKDGAGAGAWAAGMALAMQQAGMRGMPSLFVDEPAGREQIASFGNEWLILRQYFKLFPTCRWTHAPVEAVMRLQRSHGFGPADVERIDVETFRETSTLMKFPPEDSDGAQYCLPWAVAVSVVDGELGVRQILPERFSDERVLDLGARVNVQEAPDIQARFPGECLARVNVTLKDGRTLTGPTAGARGDDTDPATDEEMERKYFQLLTPVLGREAAKNLADVIDSLEHRPAADLLDLLVEAAPG
jgi:2-methylcitrate dehydratase PrpD